MKLLEGDGVLKYPVGKRVTRFLDLLFEGTRSAVDDARTRVHTGKMTIMPEQLTLLGGEFAMNRERERAERRRVLLPRIAELRR